MVCWSQIRWLALLEASVAITAFAINVAHAVSASSVPIPVSGIVIIRLARVLRLLKLSGWRSERAADAITNSEEVRALCVHCVCRGCVGACERACGDGLGGGGGAIV